MLMALRLQVGGQSRSAACSLRPAGLRLRSRVLRSRGAVAVRHFHSSGREASVADAGSGSTPSPSNAAPSKDNGPSLGDGTQSVGLANAEGGEVVKASLADSLMESRKRARPIVIYNDLSLYESSVPIQEIATECRQNCMIGTGLASVGFATLLVSIASAVPPAAFTVLLCGAFVNSYALAVMAQRVLRGMAVRHVEQITILPTILDEDATEAGGRAGDGGLGDLHHGASVATAEERLAVTPELRLEVRTASSIRWLTLVNPAPEEADADLDPQGRQASFGDICSQLRLLHIDTDGGHACADTALLVALVGTKKVIADERAEPREDAVEALRVNPGSPAPGTMLSEVSLDDVEKAAKVVSVVPPDYVIDSIGRRARAAGIAVLLTGTLFTLGESARDRDGVARWTNLPGV